MQNSDPGMKILVKGVPADRWQSKELEYQSASHSIKDKDGR